ncbi:MAG: hypothetical protein ACLRSW_10250 [Christensenellaceae bacterium]
MAVYAGVFACCSLFTLPFGGMFVGTAGRSLRTSFGALPSFGLGGPLMKAMRFVFARAGGQESKNSKGL